jgi:hypothetical protein
MTGHLERFGRGLRTALSDPCATGLHRDLSRFLGALIPLLGERLNTLQPHRV